MSIVSFFRLNGRDMLNSMLLAQDNDIGNSRVALAASLAWCE